jgi:hypothetical protein
MRGLRASLSLKDKIETIFNIEKSWKTFENAEESSQKRQRFANLESEDLNSLLDRTQAQSIMQHTLYLFSKAEIFKFYFVLLKNISFFNIFVLYYKKATTFFSVLMYSLYINTRENWENSKLCENTPFPHNFSC